MFKAFISAFVLTATVMFSMSVDAAIENTLAVIKPDAVADNHIGEILAKYESNGLKIAALKMVKISKNDANRFYAVHKDRPFYDELTTFISSGPIVAIVLQGDNAIAKNREIMGTTDPKNAAKGTIRADYAKSVGENAIHGSDSPAAAKVEIDFFFRPQEIYTR